MIVMDESLLRKPTEEVSVEEGIEICKILSGELDKHDGIGLAANQIGINKKVCIVRAYHDGKTIEHHFVNPYIESFRLPVLFRGEGCLSFPDDNVETVRFYKIYVRDSLYSSPRGFVGLAAICVYHEVDHLNGITMFDRRIKNIGPNGSCPCKSGKKFKKCCQPNLKMFETVERSLTGQYNT